MLRAVRGPGTLVPEHIRWITADTAGRVEKIALAPGATVAADTVLLELSNPDVMLQSLEADRQLAQAEGGLLTLRSSSRSQRLQEEAAIVALRTELADVRRRAAATEGLLKQELASALETQAVTEKASELGQRVTLEQARLQVMVDGEREALVAQRTQVERLRAVAQFRRTQVSSMKVVAGGVGTLSEMGLELGQWVTPGTVLAKVVQPETLKAELRIPETQARDVAVGQRAEVDTHNGVIPGHVSRVAPSATAGAVKVDVALEGALPRGARPDLSVEGVVELERLRDVVYVSRPAGVMAAGATELFKLSADGSEATRVKVRLGRDSVSTVEVLDGLAPGDKVILSDTSMFEAAHRLRLK